MNQENVAKEFSLPVEFDNYIEGGIALPPKIVLEFKTQYQKVISIQRPNDKLSVIGRIIPAPAKYHDRSVVVLPEEWKEAYNFSSSSALCKLIEPSFAKKVQFKVLDEDESDSLPPLTERIKDKSVIFKGHYIRNGGNICKVLSIDNDRSQAIITEQTLLKFGNGPDAEQYYLDDENREESIEDITTGEKRELTFKNLHKVKGVDDTIQRLKNEVVYPFLDILNGEESNPDPMGGVLLYGPPGCGKTEIATSIAEDLGVYFDSIQIGDLASKWAHQFGKNLKARFDKAAKAKGGAIIFLDELDAFAGHRSEMNHAHDRENVNVLLQLLDPKNRPPNVLVFAATNYLSSLDTAVTRSGRFDTKIGIGPPDETGRAAILRTKLNKYSVDSSSITEGFVKDIARKTIGYVGSDLNTLVEKTKTYQKARARKQETNTSSLPMIKEDLLNALQAVTPLCETEMNIERPSVKKEDLPGSEGFVDQICAEAELMFHPERFRTDIEVKPNQAFLLYGPPGTGKTSIANAVANELNILFKVVNAGENKSQWIGETVKNINKLFENARLFRPILVFIDEIDSIAQTRNSAESSHASDSINTLLTQFGDSADNENIIFVAATNRKDMIDPALLRPGRFGTNIEVERPELPNIKKQLKQQLEEIPHQLTETQIDSLANLLYQQKRTQAEISDYINSIKRHLVFHTADGDKADQNLFKNILSPSPTES
ncbi:AAA+-type ATPase, SpoVK/Ycf46/Vps4 family [Fodinibius salinus]|uniref:AAA+-type ATPase, SpoVK/Ycf46/Vps4 family n=1 Tax=Fodinibius salinus TaxID=860790 RepID=A0A5D3YNG7_9BACT|nr:AAA family ATPase [Fodinibius salinus]TYP94888.1 AAA+-type ATPase, SpoVK/Ycf46/Vps4 family [Fodinibius salinus]